MKLAILIAFVFLFFSSCEKEKDTPLFKRGELLNVEESIDIHLSEIPSTIGDSFPTSLAKFGVKGYKITYGTIYENKPIRSQALLLMPENTNDICLVAYFHGTILPLKLFDSDRKIPSKYDGGATEWREVRWCGVSLATSGYTVLLPDYIGYGTTADKEHPFVCYPELFKANIDALLAVKTFFQQQKLTYDNRLFLAGWSQGAGASLSAHKYIEADYADQFKVIASSNLAGPYNFTHFIEDVFTNANQHYRAAALYAWAAYALNRFSYLNRPCDQIFSFPVYDQFSAFDVLTSKPSELFRDYFIENLLSGNDELFRAIITENSFHSGWAPQGKIFLHHGTSDDVVPYFNSEDAYNGLNQESDNVFFYSYKNGTHDSHVDEYIKYTIEDFNKLR